MTRLLEELKARHPDTLVVGAAECDLFIPLLAFVYGISEPEIPHPSRVPA